MDTRDTTEQAELRRTARQLARELGPTTVADLDDATRIKRLTAAVRDAGWLELRDDDGSGGPIAGGVEVAIVADALGGAVADVSYSGAVLAGDLARRAGAAHEEAVVACAATLIDAALVHEATTSEPTFAVDGDRDAEFAYVVVPDGMEFRVALARIDGAPGGTDLTRNTRRIGPGAQVVAVSAPDRHLTRADLEQWRALGLALTSADLVGVMRGVTDVTV